MKIRTIDTNEESAIVTHYLQCKNSRFESPYKQEAQILLDETDEVVNGMVQEPILDWGPFPELALIPFPCPHEPRFTFIDLFSGIGGFRIAMQNLGGKCVFSSEWDKQAQKTYLVNFGEVPFGDITQERTKQFIPNDFDLLVLVSPVRHSRLRAKNAVLRKHAVRCFSMWPRLFAANALKRSFWRM